MGIEVKNATVGYNKERTIPLRFKNGKHRMEYVEKAVEHTIAAGATSTITALLPDGAIVEGWLIEVLDKIVVGTDRDTINFGEASGQAQFGAKALTSLELAAGTLIGPGDFVTTSAAGKTYAAAQNLVISPTGGGGGNLVSGKIRMTVWYRFCRGA